MSYKWIHPPIKLVDSVGRPGPGLCVQDDLNQAAVTLFTFHIPEEDRRMYGFDFSEEALARDQAAAEEGDEVEEVEQIYGFFIGGDTSGYSDTKRDPIADPLPNDVFVSMKGGVYLPIGQHSQGSHHPGDWLISIEDYEAISRGIYTPAVYTCDTVREWDPHKQIRSWR